MEKRRRLSREESREQTRALLRRSAAKAFARTGFEGASVDEISEAAGFSRGAFYSNFSDKEELFLELLTRHLDRDLASFKAAIEQCPTLESLAERIAASFHDLGSNPDWCLLACEFQLYLSRTGKRGSAFSKTYASYRKSLSAQLDQAFSRFGLRMEMTSDEVATSLIGLSHGMALERAAAGASLPREITGKAIRALLFGVAGK